MRTLQQRLMLTCTLIAIFTVLVGVLLSSGLLIRSYIRMARQSAWSMQRLALNQLARYYQQHGRWDGIESHLVVASERIAAQPFLPQQRVVLADTDRHIIFDSLGRLEGTPMPQRFASIASPIYVNGQTVGYLVTPYGLGLVDIFSENAFLVSILRMLVVGSLISGSIALLVGLLIARHLTRPLVALTQAAQRLAMGERHAPLTIPADKELADLASAFNIMAANLDRQEELRRQLVADIAHELRTPLSVLRLEIEALEDGVAQNTPETLGSLREEVTLISRLIDDLRLLSLADAGQLTLAPETLVVQDVLARVVAPLVPRAQQHGLELRIVDCSSSNGCAPLTVYADPQRLAQILHNLLENAVRYTPSGGTITLHTAAMPNQYVLFEVADTGPGIAADDVPHIFDRFYRATHARDRERGGSGLGLSIVLRLVEAHGGTITVDSVMGQGSVFRVLLPAAPTV